MSNSGPSGKACCRFSLVARAKIRSAQGRSRKAKRTNWQPAALAGWAEQGALPYDRRRGGFVPAENVPICAAIACLNGLHQ